jgi:hypothetical protein
VTIRRLTRSDLDEIAPLVASYPFKPYRNYRVMPRKAQDAVMLAEVEQTLGRDDGIVLAVADAGGTAVAVVRALEWETRFFGVPMGRIEYLLPADSPGGRARVLRAALDALKSMGVRHVSARSDVADIVGIGVLEDAGFRLMDGLVTYITRPRKEPPREVREVGTIRPFRPADAEEVIAITASAYRGFRGRFHLDPHLPGDRCDDFYVEWARQSINGQMADTVLVSEGGDGRLVGFLAWRRREPVSTVGGISVFGGGLGACRSDVPGGYAGLIRAGTIWAHEHEGVAECQTQNYNFATVRIYEAVGAHYVRAEYTLHAWLG